MLVLKRFFLKSSGNVVGVELQTNGMAVVAKGLKNDMPSIIAAEYITYDDESTPVHMLKKWVSSNGLSNAPCHIVLGSESYQLLLVEPPDVEDSEVRAAIRWRLKDLLSIPVEEAAIDVFPLPIDGNRSNKKMTYVVAVESKKIRDIVSMVESSGLVLESIDIGELAIRNVVLRLLCDENSERGIAVARIRQGTGSVYIYRQGNMYLARTFSIEYNGGLLDDLPEDDLALEFQRSLDYYERQMGQAPPSIVYVCGDNVTEDKVGATFKASLTVPLQVLDPGAVVWLEKGIDTGSVQDCLGALGGALRDDVSA